jgi:hypothetical protein
VDFNYKHDQTVLKVIENLTIQPVILLYCLPYSLADNRDMITRQVKNMADNNHKKESLSQQTHQTIDVIGADNLVINDVMTADNAPYTGQLSADSITIQAENAPDSMVNEEYSMVNADDRQTDNSENIEFFDKISILELQKKYNIKRDALYKRMGYLRITTYKVSGRACLYAEQVAHMDGLHEHIKGGHPMDTYPKPEPTGPSLKQDKSLHIVEDEPYSEDNVKTSSSIVMSPNSTVEPTRNTPSPTVINTVISQADVEQIKSEAQQRVKAKRLAVIQVARAYEENLDKLPFEIQQEIKEAEMAAISTPLSHKNYYDPNALAQLAIQNL